MAKDKEDPPLLEFKIFREDEQDSYKPNSTKAIKKLAEQPPRETLEPEEEEMLQMVGSEWDRTMPLDEIVDSPKKAQIPDDIMEQIERLPSWLQAMMIVKYPIIHGRYKNNTLTFVRAIANRIDKKYRARLRSGGNEVAFIIREEAGDRSSKYGTNRLRSSGDDTSALTNRNLNDVTESEIALRIAHESTRWKKNASHSIDDDYWCPTNVSRANLKLRAALQTRAAYSDLATVAEDEDVLRVDEDALESDDGEPNPKNKHDYWNKIFDNEEIMARAEKRVEREFTKHKKLTAQEKSEIKEAKKNKKKIKRKDKKKHCSLLRNLGRKGQEHFFVSKHIKRMKKRKLLAQGYFRDDTRLFHTGCGTARNPPKRLERTYRCDDSFHNYCVALAAWSWFKTLIMIIICINAIVLAFETWEPFGQDNAFAFEIIDHVFVAVYTIEFIIKVYAHPYRYWRSGFNIFDFIILVISLGKSIIDWTDVSSLDSLRALLIFRALRILRGISFSVQLQVLVSALVETIKTHVLSVVILLVLLLYVTAIIAFYFFGKEYPEAFGSIGRGMLNMLRVLTIDGWTDLNEEMKVRAGVTGTLFVITCIVLGNFLFSNIFVAIIIMNISEATDNFRDKQRGQRETLVRLKKEKVFRRQKLDLRQLFARQRTSAFTDFFSIGGQFQKLLRHDDLVAMSDVVTSPLWIDSVYQAAMKANQTSNVLMNLHREMANNMREIMQLYGENRVVYEPISRDRFNRYLKMKAKLALLKEEILRTNGKLDRPPVRFKIASLEEKSAKH